MPGSVASAQIDPDTRVRRSALTGQLTLLTVRL